MRSSVHGVKDLYIIGRDANWTGMNLYGKEKKLQAFTNDLMMAVAQKNNMKFQWIDSHAFGLLDNLDHGYYDAIIMEKNERLDGRIVYLLSSPLIDLGPVLVVREDSPVRFIEELKGKTIGYSLSNPGPFSSFANKTSIIVVNFDNASRAVEALVQMEVDGIVLNTLAAYTMAEGYYKDQIRVISAPLIEQGLYLIALENSGNKEFIHGFNVTLNELKASGEYENLLKKWDLIDPQTRFKQ